MATKSWPESRVRLSIALESLARLSAGGRSVAVLGDMNELGEQAPHEHRVAGRRAGELGIDLLFCLGNFATETAAGAVDGGLAPGNIHIGTGHEQIAELIEKHISPRDWILVKGSRGMHMERIVDSLAAGDRN